MDVGLLLLRVALGLMVFAHGTQKAFGWFQGPGLSVAAGLFEKWGFRPGRPLVLFSAACECVGGLLIILGLATPLAATVVLGILVVACSPAAANGIWATKGGFELPLMYSCIAAAVGFTGSGRFSLDDALGLRYPAWTGVAVLCLGLLSSVPALLRRHAVLAQESSTQP
jgi:putative oxidoreductase